MVSFLLRNASLWKPKDLALHNNIMMLNDICHQASVSHQRCVAQLHHAAN